MERGGVACKCVGPFTHTAPALCNLQNLQNTRVKIAIPFKNKRMYKKWYCLNFTKLPVPYLIEVLLYSLTHPDVVMCQVLGKILIQKNSVAIDCLEVRGFLCTFSAPYHHLYTLFIYTLALLAFISISCPCTLSPHTSYTLRKWRVVISIRGWVSYNVHGALHMGGLQNSQKGGSNNLSSHKWNTLLSLCIINNTPPRSPLPQSLLAE